MIITPEEHEELKNLSEPLMNWIKDTCHPHCEIVLDSMGCRLVEGVAGCPSDYAISLRDYKPGTLQELEKVTIERDNLNILVDRLEESAQEWSNYVQVDTAPRTLKEHLALTLADWRGDCKKEIKLTE